MFGIGVFRRLGHRTILPIAGLALLSGLFLIRILTGSIDQPSIGNKLQDFVTLSASVIIEALPFILLGLLLSIAVQVWLPQNILFKILPKQLIPRRLVLSFLGIFLPVCECGNVPLARGLMIKGMTVGDSITFLLAAPILNPVTIITTQQAFGSDNTILAARLVGAFLIANIVGWLFTQKGKDKTDELLTPEFSSTCKAHRETSHANKTKVSKSLNIFSKEANAIAPALFVGSFIAGFIQVAVPREILTDLGGHIVLSVIAMMALAFIVSICANVDAFFALAFANTFTAGSIVSFLIFGPIVDIKMLALLKTTYKTKVLATIVLITTLVSGTIGLAVNYVF